MLVATPHALAAPALHDSAKAYLGWFLQSALPFWLEKSWDQKRGGFFEQFLFDGQPDALVERRVNVQWQQIEVCARAHLLGWGNSMQTALMGVEYLLDKTSFGPRGMQFAHLMAPNAHPIDDSAHLADCAAALSALAWVARASNDAQIFALADKMLVTTLETFIDGPKSVCTRLPVEGFNALADIRALFDACLALAIAIHNPRAAQQAARLKMLFVRRLHPDQDALVSANFNDSFEVIPGMPAAAPLENALWCVLLHDYAYLTATPVSAQADALLQTTLRYCDSSHGFLKDSASGPNQMDSHSLSGQGALIRALLAAGEAGDTVADALAAEKLQDLLTTYLSGPFAGGWHDQYTAEGEVGIDCVPARSLLPLFRLAYELTRLNN